MNFRYIEDFAVFQSTFTEVFQKNGLFDYTNNDTIEKFAQLTELMLQTNENMNITALTTLEKIIPLHYADCVLAASYIPVGSHVIDIGCGGGFPILPLAIVRPDLNLLGIDSTEKKVRYVQSAANRLGLHNVQTLAARAEELGRDENFRETFDIAVSRAVARLNILSELALPLVRVGGTFVAMKGAAGVEEMYEAASGCQKLGFCVCETHELTLQTCAESEKRVILQIRKIKPTPSEYPRAFGTIKKKPL